MSKLVSAHARKSRKKITLDEMLLTFLLPMHVNENIDWANTYTTLQNTIESMHPVFPVL